MTEKSLVNGIIKNAIVGADLKDVDRLAMAHGG
jgi:hypothetical protein